MRSALTPPASTAIVSVSRGGRGTSRPRSLRRRRTASTDESARSPRWTRMGKQARITRARRLGDFDCMALEAALASTLPLNREILAPPVGSSLVSLYDWPTPGIAPWLLVARVYRISVADSFMPTPKRLRVPYSTSFSDNMSELWKSPHNPANTTRPRQMASRFSCVRRCRSERRAQTALLDLGPILHGNFSSYCAADRLTILRTQSPRSPIGRK